MNVLSLFDGISCGRLALQRIGIEPENYFASEIDKFAIQVSASNWPDIQHIGCVKSVSAANLPKIDLLIGGSPCQGFSFAGKGLNFEDPRSALFFEYVRILNEVRRINTDVIFMLENVPMKREHQMVISKYLGVEPIEINGALVSAQNRRRLFWTNIKARPFNLFGDMVSMIPQPKDKGILLKDILQDESEIGEKYYLSEARIKFMLEKQGQFTQLNGEKAMTQTARGDAGWQGDFIIQQTPRGANNGGAKALNGKTPSVSANGWEHNNHLIAHNSWIGGAYHQSDRVDLPNRKCRTIESHATGGFERKTFTSGNFRRLTPIEVERLFTLPDNYTASVSDSQRYRCMGNGWIVDVIAHILSHIEK